MAHPTNTSRTTGTGRAPYQWLALVIGVVYLLVGLAGFAVTGFDGFTEYDHDQTLLGFAVNPLHNIVHLLIGALGVALWARRSTARLYGWILALGYGATFVYGLLVVDDPNTNILNINQPDNVLHVVSALAGLAIALWPDRDRKRS
jgi:ABC-type transport system involved in multi-copper enzyme maturation permease subunit